MSAPDPTADPTQPTDPANDDACLEKILHAILDAGAALLQDLLADPALSPAAKAEPYERIARTLRRTVVLARHVAETPTRQAPSAADRRTRARRHIIRDVENAIETRVPRPEQAESLRDELNERLDDPEFERDLATRSIAEIVRDLIRDLGLDPDYSHKYRRRTPADIRNLNARAAAAPQPAHAAPPDLADPDLLDPDLLDPDLLDPDLLDPDFFDPDLDVTDAEDPDLADLDADLTRANTLLARLREVADG